MDAKPMIQKPMRHYNYEHDDARAFYCVFKAGRTWCREYVMLWKDVHTNTDEGLACLAERKIAWAEAGSHFMRTFRYWKIRCEIVMLLCIWKCPFRKRREDKQTNRVIMKKKVRNLMRYFVRCVCFVVIFATLIVTINLVILRQTNKC